MISILNQFLFIRLISDDITKKIQDTHFIKTFDNLKWWQYLYNAVTIKIYELKKGYKMKERGKTFLCARPLKLVDHSWITGLTEFATIWMYIKTKWISSNKKFKWLRSGVEVRMKCKIRKFGGIYNKFVYLMLVSHVPLWIVNNIFTNQYVYKRNKKFKTFFIFEMNTTEVASLHQLYNSFISF